MSDVLNPKPLAWADQDQLHDVMLSLMFQFLDHVERLGPEFEKAWDDNIDFLYDL